MYLRRMNCEYSPQITVFDFMISLFLGVMFIVSASQKKKRLEEFYPQYGYYLSGMAFKFIAVFIFCLIFIYYYDGGDTLAYHQGAVAMKNLFYENPANYFDLLFNEITWEKYINYFSAKTCYPPTWMIKKESNFSVIRVASLVQLFLPNAILASNIIIARIAYGGIFRLYNMFCDFFPGKEKPLAFAFLFTPSVAFWGSGIMKDTLALTGICYLIVLFYQLFIKRSGVSVLNIIGMFLAGGTIILVKSYLFLALLPGLIIWLNFQRLKKVTNPFVRLFVFPVVLVGSFMGIIAFYGSNPDLFGVYSADAVLDEAAKVQQDLVRSEAYGDNSFDIGKFEPTAAGITSKIPAAIFAGLFRPFIAESGGSPTMLVAGLENLVLIWLFTIALIRRRFFGFFTFIFSNPVLILSLIFTILLSFSIGLTSANFGALVRYKVPLVPFFVSIILLGIYKDKKEVKEEEKKPKKITYKAKTSL